MIEKEQEYRKSRFIICHGSTQCYMISITSVFNYGPCYMKQFIFALTDFIFMVRNIFYMFVTGPDIIKKVIYEGVTQEDLDRAKLHASKTGIADLVFHSEIKASLQVHRML